MSEEEITKIKSELDLLKDISKEFGDYRSIWSIIMNLKSRLKFYEIDYAYRSIHWYYRKYSPCVSS